MKTVKQIHDCIINKIIPDCIELDLCTYEHYGNDFINTHKEYDEFPFMGKQLHESFINVTYVSNVSLALGSGSYPELCSNHFNNIEKEFFGDYLKDKGLSDGDTLTDQDSEEYHNEWDVYSSECLDYFYTVRIFIKDGFVHVISGTNTDFTYGRFTAGLVGTFDKKIPIENITFELLEDTIQNAFMGI